MTNKAQLTEQQQLQEELLDEIGDFTKAITKKIGQGVGAVQGAGQKIKGVTKRSVDALGKSFQQGKQQTQKAVAGQDYKAPQPKAQAQGQAQGQAQAQGQTQTKPTGVMGNLAKNIGNVALDTAAGTGYDYRQGVNPNPTKQVPAGKKDTQAQTQTQATKRTKTGGKVAGQTSDTKSAQYQRDRRAAKKGGGSAMKQGIDQAQIDGANQGIANMQKQAGKTATKVPGQKAPAAQVDKNKDGKDDKSGKPMAPAPTGKGPSSGAGGAAAQVDKNKDGKDDKTGKPISKTAQNVGKNTGVNTAKIGGQKVDLNDPKMANMRAAIDKALGKGTTASIDKLDPPGKEKLKKALA
jgi:hypothetical protein